MIESPKSISLGDALSAHGFFSLYGKPISDLPAKGFGRVASPSLDRFAHIRAYKVGDVCIRLPQSILMLVGGDGLTPDADDKCARKDEVIWNVFGSDRSLAMASTVGTVSDLLDEISTRGIDGGLQLENPSIQNGQACVDVHAWAKIEIFGAKVEFDQRFPVCIPLEGCHTVWEVGWANVQVCFQAPNRLCAKLCIGKWGLSRCWDYCVPVNLIAPVGSMAPDCNCHGS